MIVEGISLKNFRNHADSLLEFGPGVNALIGDNGEGKTNVLEAVSFLSLTKSFYASADATVVQIGSEGFELDGTILSGSGARSRVRVVYTGDPPRKVYEVNGGRPERLASAIGRFPIVILSPENGGVTAGGPAERRKFIDLVLSQIAPAYLEALLEYRQVVRQRNRVLMDCRLRGAADADLLAPWDVSLATLGGVIIERRQKFLAEFRSYVIQAYRQLAEGAELPDLAYVSQGISREGDVRAGGAADAIASLLGPKRAEEIRRGTTLVGPHRDDIRLALNGIPMQEYASQGQHKTMLVALKVAEHRYVAERRSEPPILLLDDVFSELDGHRSERILRLTAELGQVLITTTDERVFHGTVTWSGSNRKIMVEHGTCRPAAA